MSDNLRRYLAIREALIQLCPAPLSGNLLRHLHTLAALINGIVASGRTSLPAIASHLPNGKQRESRIKRFERFLKNERVCQETFFMPFAGALLARLPAGPLVLVMDASDIGRGCLALMVSLVFQQRALPLAWIVVKGNKGHVAEQTHRHLLEKLSPLIPPERRVIFLGEGEFDGCGLLAALSERGWCFVCRTAKNAPLCEEETGYAFSFADLFVEAGELIAFEQVRFTEARWGPLLALAVWEEGYKEPLFLVSNLELGEEARFWYKKRFLIETFFSDQKSRGFFLHKSHLSEPSRLARLLIATCLAYIWLVLLGAQVKRNPVWRGKVHRSGRCDLSLFSLGRAWLQECFNEGWHVPVVFTLSKL